ncbi:hypothetical protein [Bacillus sp. ISL-39]|uniref:hypothetical protein n=1 Tax=Bacillus sp. ISL-39 TaxID=2819124 RepID=UPI001BE7FA81|nr:hypothetical protein [Bacillus sp. ISL-39]
MRIKTLLKVLGFIWAILFFIMFLSLFGLFGMYEIFPYNYYLFGILCIPLIIEAILKRRLEKKKLGFIKEVSGKVERHHSPFGGEYDIPRKMWLRLFKRSLVLECGGDTYTIPISRVVNVKLIKVNKAFKGQGRTRGDTFSSNHDGIKIIYTKGLDLSIITIYRGSTTTGFGIRKQEYEEMIELIFKQMSLYGQSQSN